ncbi:MAG: hypothetical protein GY811_29300 [Myxococcales bacterium]|nr:hypothetical protein [Myxococcales bacterium]
MPWWQRLLLRIRALFQSEPKQLPAASLDELAVDLQEAMSRLATEKGAVLDAAQRAVADFGDLRSVLMGPGASSDAAEDVSVLAEAEDVLRSMLTRAPEVQALAAIAGKRGSDKAGRAAAGEALLQLRDQGRYLHELASASLLWASSKSLEDLEKMRSCAERVSN